MFFEPIPLNLPFYPFKLSIKDSTTYIFDEIRRKYLVLTPEEWVRQHFIKFLVNEKKFSSALIQIEGGLKVNKLQKRSDILIYSQVGTKLLLVECKAPHIKITQETFNQVARYNTVHQAPWLAVTNGLDHYYAKINFSTQQWQFVEKLPNFDLL